MDGDSPENMVISMGFGPIPVGQSTGRNDGRDIRGDTGINQEDHGGSSPITNHVKHLSSLLQG